MENNLKEDNICDEVNRRVLSIQSHVVSGCELLFLQSHFDLYLQQKPELPVQQFIINAFLNDGRVLIDTTQKVRFLD